VTIEVSFAEMAHLPDLMRIQAKAYGPGLVESEAVLESRVRAGKGYSFVATGDGEVLGYVLAHPWPRHASPGLENVFSESPPGSDALHIHDMALDERAKGQGVSRLLLAAVEGAASGRFQASTLVAVQGAQTFWTHVGFEDEGPAEGYDEGARFMSKRLR